VIKTMLELSNIKIEAGNLNAEGRKGKRRGTPRIRYELMKCCT
jgi:hypothetical protein